MLVFQIFVTQKACGRLRHPHLCVGKGEKYLNTLTKVVWQFSALTNRGCGENFQAQDEVAWGSGLGTIFQNVVAKRQAPT